MNDKNCFRKQPWRLSTPVRLGVAAVAACFISGPALSNPLNPTVINGTAAFSQAGNVLTVTNSPGAIINWQKFSIQAGETTHFAQTSASSSVLNRVLSDPSAIYGTLSSNGRVWLVNPAGIMVGPGGRVDVAAFVASTLNISNADFLAGRNVFINDGNAKNVINQGEIRTPAGGSVYLIGSNVSNEGLITTPQGETLLAAGATVSLIDSATPGVKVDITGAEGNATNLGTITAEAGRIGIAGVIVRNSGTLNASSVVNEGGRIFLKASQDAYVDGNGRIVTTGTRGGSVEVLGNRVAVMDNAEIDVSGTNGGGRIMIGGDYQGKNSEIQNASITWFGPDATLKADATEVGDGGTVIVWADDTTWAYGSIWARGGASGGNGGFVETSGKNYLAVDGIRVDTRAPQGQVGNWLLDPSDLTILNGVGTGFGYSSGGGIFATNNTGGTSTIYGGTIQSALGSSNVILQTDGGSGGNGNITATGVSISSTTTNSLTLVAFGGAGATGNITITSSMINVNGGVTMLAGWDGSGFASSDVVPFTGVIDIVSSTILSNSGAINLWAGNDIALSASGSTGTWIQGPTINVRAGNDITLTGGYDASGGVLIGRLSNSATAVTIVAGNDVMIDGGEGGVGIGAIGPALAAGEVYIANGSTISTTSAFSDITINAQKSVTINGPVISAGNCGDCGDGVWITAGYSPTAFDNSFGGDIKLGSQSVITGYSVGLTAQSEGVAAGDIVQDPGGSITITGNYSGYSNFFRADGNLHLDGMVLASNLAGGGVYGYAGYSGAPGKTLRVSNLLSPTGGNLYFESTGDAVIGSINAPTGEVVIQAGGAIYDNNGTALNITADSISMNSQYGAVAGQLAISMDTSATSSLSGYVASGATFGGISIRNLGLQPESVSIYDLASSQSAINFYNGGDLTLNGSQFFSYGITQIGSGGTLNVNSNISGYDVTLAAPTINITAEVYADNDISFKAANVTASSYGGLTADGLTSNITGTVSGNITLDQGAFFRAGNDIRLTLTGADSTISLSNGGHMLADYVTVTPSTIYLTYLARSSGGVLINGLATTTSLPGGSGFFVVNTSTPATAGAGLEIVYGSPFVVDPCVSSPDLCRPPVPIENPILQVVELVAVDPCASNPDSVECKLQVPGDEDKEGSFGGQEELGIKDEKWTQKTIPQCGI